MTPEEVRALRNHARGMLDEIGTNTTLRNEILIANQEERMRPHLAAMHDLFDQYPNFFSAFNYQWALDPGAYDTAIEAAWQLRALRALAAIHATGSPLWSEKKLRYDGLLITYQLIVNYAMSGANFRPVGPMNAVRLPFGFFEMSLIMLRGILASRLHDTSMQFGIADPSWLAIQSNRSTDAAFFNPFIADLVARLIAARSDQPDVALPGIVRSISSMESFPETGIDVGTEPLPAFIDDAHYLISEFVLLHEVGHALHQDAPGDRSLSTEIRADFCGAQLFAVSWGWRFELLSRSLLDEVGRIVIGPRLTLAVLRAWIELSVAVEARLSTLDASDNPNGSGLTDAALTEFDQRIASVNKSLSELVASYAQRGEPYSQESAAMVNSLLEAVHAFGAQAVKWTRELPDKIFRDALNAI